MQVADVVAQTDDADGQSWWLVGVASGVAVTYHCGCSLVHCKLTP
jgi:hypothetical protein